MQVIKAAAAISLKHKLETFILKREDDLQSTFFKIFKDESRIKFAGPADRSKCVPIVSFAIIYSQESGSTK